MLPSNSVTEQLREAAAQLHDLAAPRASSEVYVFFSYDLSNSTHYKTVGGSQWPTVVQKFYELIADSHQKRQLDVRHWKYVGDEVLLYSRLGRISDVYRVVQNTYDVLQDTIDRLHLQFVHAQPFISVKATIWCARVRDVPPQEWEKGAEEFAQGDCRNLIIRPDASRPDVDFLGPDIDIGFRIGKFALRKRLVVSADLAYLLWKERGNMSESIENELFIVSYQHLNGVWNGRRYPIIWYEKKWADFTSSFAYDEHFDSELVKEATTLGGQQAPEDRRLGYLEKVYRDLDQAKDIEKFCDYLRSLDVHPVEEVPVLVPMARGAELHCVAVCFRSDGRVLVAKRKSDKNIMPEKWEFGCGQLHPNETFEQCLQRAYKEDFSAQLKFSDQARPVRTFLIDDKKKKRIVPGLIFVAEVTNDSAVKAHRHAKIDWIDPNHITLNAAECVPDFELSIRMAQKLRSAGNLCPTPSGALDNAVSIQDS